MEEIIATINRAIAEDGATREPVLTAGAEQDDILELTEALDEDGRARRIEPGGPAAALSATPTRTEPEPRVDAATLEPGRERLISAAAAKAAAMAFARLGGRSPGRPAASELPLGAAAARTLEDVVREALVPLLRSWLDEHLPAIVERLVREEIARVAAGAGGRR